MDRFIELTMIGGSPILVNGGMIQTMMIKGNETWVRLMGGNVLSVVETPDQILKILKKSSTVTLYNYKTQQYEKD